MFFIERLLDLLKEKGIPRKKMLDDLGLANGSFVNWKTRGSIPNAETLSRIADYFEVTSDYLLGKTDIKEKAPAKSESSFTEAELAIIEMYRVLDDAGKITVGTVLKKEYDRTARAKGLILSTVAARSADGEETVHTEYLPDLSEVPADDTDF